MQIAYVLLSWPEKFCSLFCNILLYIFWNNYVTLHIKICFFFALISVSMNTCITSLVAKKRTQPCACNTIWRTQIFSLRTIKGWLSMQTDLNWQYASHTRVFLNLSKSIIKEEASILFQVCKRSTKSFPCNEFVLSNFIRTGSGKISE